ncbi:hypothetical protein COOONC_26639 [Cooperia oncophora]
MEVLAIDYGSPQLFTLANVTIVPVTVSPVRGLRVNVATEEYQIFEWESPSYGHPEKYRLTIARGENNCQPEKTVDSYGGLDWREALFLSPYNTESDKQKVERACEWNKQLGRAVWARQKEKDKCKPQASVLTHLGMLGTFALNANGVSTIHTVARFIRDLLTVPAFSTDPTITAHFDQKIAEQAALVIDSVLQIDFDSLQGNTTLAKVIHH